MNSSTIISPNHCAPAITANGLRKSYRGVCVVDRVSLEVAPGEIVGVLGPNGAGKSTTVKMLYGAVIPDEGSVVVQNYRVADQGRLARQLIGVVSQDGDLERDFSIVEDLVVYASFYGVAYREALARARGLVNQLGLTDHQEKRPDELSGGQRRKVSLARALMSSPSVVFLDEPTTGLDPDARQEFWRLVASLREDGIAVLLTTHYMDEAERLCDRVLLMQRGRIVRTGTPARLVAEIVGERVIEVEGATESVIRELALQHNVRYRAFGVGYAIVASRTDERTVLEALQHTQADRISQRAANLEDVFLALTGEDLGKG